jgi:hypothetical protein
MDDERIENLLRKAPEAKAPEGLREQLLRGVRVPRAAETGARWREQSWTRRWLPALSFAVFFLGCLVVIGKQTGELRSLQQENARLRAGEQNLEQLRAENAEYQRLKLVAQELERLKKDSAELERLRGEVAQLKSAVQEADKLRVENQRLQAENAKRAEQAAASAAGTLDDAIANEKAKAQRAACVNNLKQIGMSLRTWATDYEETFPPDYISMTNELLNPKLMQCPSDSAHNVRGWADVAAGNVSYEFLTPGIKHEKLSPQTVAVRCPIHHNYLMIDTSVQMLSPEGEKNLKMINGRLTLVRPGFE